MAKFKEGVEKKGGRKKGTPNANTKTLRDMILSALEAAGGEEYLLKQAEEEPKAFMQLVAKVLPLQVIGQGGGAIQIESKVIRVTTQEPE